VLRLFVRLYPLRSRIARSAGHPRLGEGMTSMAVEYVCEYCGHAGRVHGEDDVDAVQCRDCGELVVPLPRGSGVVDSDD
jgi:DNA-directed RNA polymerase subunit RPC12/RpoP